MNGIPGGNASENIGCAWPEERWEAFEYCEGANKNPFAGKTSEGEFDHLKGRLALAELRSAAGSLEAVLK